MKKKIKQINFEKLYDFYENIYDTYSLQDWSDMISMTVSYGEYAVRNKINGNDDEAGLLLSSALTCAYLVKLAGVGNGYYETKRDEMDADALIIHYAIKLVDAMYHHKPYEIQQECQDNLINTIYEYIALKDSDASDCCEC